MTDRFTALDKINENSTIALNTAFRRRNKAEVRIANHTQEYHLGYDEGQAAAYNDAASIMKKELQRLKNLFQNGALSTDEFGVY